MADMTPANFIAFAQTRHGERWIQPMAEETDYSFAQIYGIAKRGRRVTKRLARIVSELPAEPEGKSAD
jgi:hypothetical protein